MLLDGDELVVEPAFADERRRHHRRRRRVPRRVHLRAAEWIIRRADMLRFANAAAAVSCTRAGAMASVPALREVETLLSGAMSASVSTRPIASGSVTPVRNASVGARSIGADRLEILALLDPESKQHHRHVRVVAMAGAVRASCSPT